MIAIRALRTSDLAAARRLWKRTEGLCLDASDSPRALAVFLRRNPGFSFAAVEGRRLVGAVLGGHDGRRGFLYHLAVARNRRRSGLGLRLVDAALDAFAAWGIPRCHCLVLAGNRPALRFWPAAGFIRRRDIVLHSAETEWPTDGDGRRATP